MDVPGAGEEVEDREGQPDEPGEADHDQDVALPAGAVDVAGEIVVGGDGVRNGAPVDEDPDAGAGEDQQTEDPEDEVINFEIRVSDAHGNTSWKF